MENNTHIQNAEVTTTQPVDAEIQQKLAELKLPLGRPANPNSARQKRIKELEAKRKAGKLKLGRPTVKNSARQKKLAKIVKLKASGVEIKRGRPSNPNSANAIKAKKKAEALAAGIVNKKGRPSNPNSARQQKLNEKNAKIEKLKQELIAKKTRFQVVTKGVDGGEVNYSQSFKSEKQAIKEMKSLGLEVVKLVPFVEM